MYSIFSFTLLMWSLIGERDKTFNMDSFECTIDLFLLSLLFDNVFTSYIHLDLPHTPLYLLSHIFTCHLYPSSLFAAHLYLPHL